MRPEPVGTAMLEGTEIRPQLVVRFDYQARHAANGEPLTAWIKKLPSARWDSALRAWLVTGTGPDPDGMFHKAGIDVDLGDFDGELVGLNDLVAPWVRRSEERPGLALVRPRLAGWEECRDRLGPSAKWDKTSGRFEIPLIDLAKDPETLRPGLHIEDEAANAALDAAAQRRIFHTTRTDVDAHAAKAALSTGIGEQQALDSVAKLNETTGGVPDWFGFDLMPYQNLGALAAAAGRTLICDEPGLGKTPESMAVAAITGAVRVLVVCPPIVLTNWRRELVRSGLFDDDQIAVIVPSRKVPALPAQGAVVVSDSLLVSRPELWQQVVDWDPQTVIADEAHRMRTWKSARSETMRDLAANTSPGAMRVALTGTPLFNNPIELAPLLAFTGHLDPVFGGFNAFTERYCRRDKFNRWLPRVRNLPELRRILDEHVWVHRHKEDVLPDLPTKSLYTRWLDVPLTDYRRAHADLVVRIDDWLDDFAADHNGRMPDPDEVERWSRGRIGFMSPLRMAAGMAKVPATVDMLVDWLEAHQGIDDAGNPVTERPLIVWAYHHEVIDALAEQVTAKLPREQRSDALAVIDGRTSQARRTAIVDNFQAGRVGVLIAQIAAAGVGLTLTRSSDAWFAETDWDAALIQQAEDRINRIGATNTSQYTTFIAEGTLDGHIHAVRNNKDDLVSTVTGRDGKAHAQQGLEATALQPSQILARLVDEQIESRLRGRHRKAA